MFTDIYEHGIGSSWKCLRIKNKTGRSIHFRVGNIYSVVDKCFIGHLFRIETEKGYSWFSTYSNIFDDLYIFELVSRGKSYTEILELTKD